MMINELMEQRNITKYRLSKQSGIPYSTITDICSGKTQLEKCSAETIYMLSRQLDVSMEAMIAPCLDKRCSFELFKSNVCHRAKELGDVRFIIEVLEKDDIRKYYNKKWYPECLYLLAMLDYLSRINNVPLCTSYDDLRHSKLSETVYPTSIIAASAASKDDAIREQARRNAIPEFMRFNIVENEVRDVI